MKKKMLLPEFCAYLFLNGHCDSDDISCETCILDSLMLQGINFEIKESDIPINEKNRGNK